MSNSNLENDQLIVWQLKLDNSKVFDKIFNTYWKPLYISAYNVLKDKKVCEDIVQDIFISLWKNRKTIEIKVSLEKYLFSCVRYQVFNQFRKNRTNLRPEIFQHIEERCSSDNPESKLVYKELEQKVDSIVDELPEKCKLVYKMSRDEQLTHKEISNKLNISPKTVENHITKALFVLRTSMGGFLCLAVLLSISFF